MLLRSVFLWLALSGAPLVAQARPVDGMSALPTGEEARPRDAAPQDAANEVTHSTRRQQAGRGFETVSLSPGAILLSSRFGWRGDPVDGGTRFHAGVDIPAPVGTGVLAVRAGEVIFAGYAGGYGNLVVIDHGDSLRSRYAHLRRIFVVAGKSVATGERIGEVGSTGRATGPHLHYEVRKGLMAVDPLRAVLKVSDGLVPEPLWSAPEREVAPRWSWTFVALPVPVIP